MIHHYILLKYKPGTPETHINEFMKRMSQLPQTISSVLSLQIGRDMLQEQRSWDVLLDMEFDSLESLRAYQSHQAHIDVMDFNQPMVADVASIDFEKPITF